MIPSKAALVAPASRPAVVPAPAAGPPPRTAHQIARRGPQLPASVGARKCEVNYNPLSYIRHITNHFLLDGKRCFMVKSRTMSSLPVASNGMPGNLAVVGGGAPALAAGAGNASPTFSPLYQQIKALITQSLQSGEWKPGELIPSEVELAMRFKVSQGTVRKAIDELSAENLVVRRQGKGTFVATHHEARAQFRFVSCGSNPIPARRTTLTIGSSTSSGCGRRRRLPARSTSNPAIL